MAILMNIQTAFLAPCPVLAVTSSLMRIKGQSQVVQQLARLGQHVLCHADESTNTVVAYACELTQ